MKRFYYYFVVFDFKNPTNRGKVNIWVRMQSKSVYELIRYVEKTNKDKGTIVILNWMSATKADFDKALKNKRG